MATLADTIQKLMNGLGAQEVAAFEVTTTDGTVMTISSESHPALQRPAEDFVTVEPKQSAEAGAERG